MLLYYYIICSQFIRDLFNESISVNTCIVNRQWGGSAVMALTWLPVHDQSVVLDIQCCCQDPGGGQICFRAQHMTILIFLTLTNTSGLCKWWSLCSKLDRRPADIRVATDHQPVPAFQPQLLLSTPAPSEQHMNMNIQETGNIHSDLRVYKALACTVHVRRKVEPDVSQRNVIHRNVYMN